MTLFQIILLLVLILTCYYAFLIGKEMLKINNHDEESKKATEEQEIDITEDMVNFDVTEIDPDDILVEDVPVSVTKYYNENESSDTGPANSTPVLPYPLDVLKLHKLVQDYNPDNPSPELDSIVFIVSDKSES